jgi:hypothetical protein
MARFYYQNRCVFKVELRQFDGDFDARFFDILDYLASTLNVDRKLLTFEITQGEVRHEEKEAC